MEGSPPGVWERALEFLEQKLRPSQFHTWFQAIDCLEVDDRSIYLAVPSRSFRDWILKNYRDVLQEAVRRSDGVERSVEFVVRPLPKVPPRPPEAPPKIHNQVLLNPLYTFENFVVGPSNRLAHAAAVAVTESPGTGYNPLFLPGAAGLGKTHLLQAAAHAALVARPDANLVYLSCEAFVNQFISAVAKGDLESFRYRFRHVDFLFIDDIHFLARKDRTQEEFFHTFNTLYNAQRQIVLSSDSPPKEIPTLEERLVSRFKWGLVARVEPPSFETRMAIIHSKAKLRGRELPQSVTEYIASRIETNIRELEGAINKIQGYAALVQKPISLGMAKEALRDSFAPAREATIADIHNEVTNYFDLKPADVLSRKRSKSIVFPRQIGMYLARELTGLSLNQIGEYFGGRDHSTVLYSTDKIRRLLDSDPLTQETLESLRKKILGNA
ncbi:MAG: chromosomal replication initiator protein DnaA [Planctomycetota bacterium]|nr:chromosomal replication initiator protein DnaA [Planctomycetota bacterium]